MAVQCWCSHLKKHSLAESGKQRKEYSLAKNLLSEVFVSRGITVFLKKKKSICKYRHRERCCEAGMWTLSDKRKKIVIRTWKCMVPCFGDGDIYDGDSYCWF